MEVSLSDHNNTFTNHGIEIKKKKIFKRNAKYIIWTSKYFPRLTNIIGQDHIIKVILNFIKNKNLPHLLFYGPPGTGKTSLAHAIKYVVYKGDKDRIADNVLELNASDENGINVIRGIVINFANMCVSSSYKDDEKKYKLIILDEADSMTSEAQTALKKIMETTCAITRFIIICNYESKIISPLKSRCVGFCFKPISDDIMINKLKQISINENLVFTEKALALIAKISLGDARRAINIIQNAKYFNNKIIDSEVIYSITSYIDENILDSYWNGILTSTPLELCDITQELINEGYMLIYVFEYLKNKVVSSNLTDYQISKISVRLANMERIITNGGGNYIQLLTILVYINSIYKNIKILNQVLF